MRESIDEMFRSLAAGPAIYQPSKFWEQLNEQNVAQLEEGGLGELKRTLAQNYFTWVVGMRSPLFRHLLKHTSLRDRVRVMAGLPKYDRSVGLSFRRFYELQIFTRMVWLAAQQEDRLGLLEKLEEPAFGNPFDTRFQGRLISQDLANSVLELYSMFEDRMPAVSDKFTVCEIGAGYGRNAYVVLSSFPKAKYIIADIPPALYVSQEYLSKVLTHKNIFKFRPFTDFSEIKNEFMAADVVFLLPHQLELLELNSVDYFVNISSFHEMRHAQVKEYFGLVDGLTRGYFYVKQWTSFYNRDDDMTISEGDYPFKSDWKNIFRRTPVTHPQFFEALFKID